MPLAHSIRARSTETLTRPYVLAFARKARERGEHVRVWPHKAVLYAVRAHEGERERESQVTHTHTYGHRNEMRKKGRRETTPRKHIERTNRENRGRGEK